MIKAFNKFVGRDLGDAFESVPGQFREHEVVVGAYRPPDHRDVVPLVGMMCDWLRKEFGFAEESAPDFYTGVIEAIVESLRFLPIRETLCGVRQYLNLRA